MLIKLVYPFDESLSCWLGNSHDASRIKLVAEKTESSVNSTDERLVGMLLYMQLRQRLIHDPHRPPQLPAGRCQDHPVAVSRLRFQQLVRFLGRALKDPLMTGTFAFSTTTDSPAGYYILCRAIQYEIDGPRVPFNVLYQVEWTRNIRRSRHVILSSAIETEARMNFAIAMKLFAAVVVFSASIATADQVDTNVERDESAKQVAKAWFTSLMQGETAVTTSLSGVPFNFDGKQQVKTYSELKQLYDQIVAKKGKRDVKTTSIKIKSSSPEKVEVILMIENDDEGITVLVKPGAAFRVVGFVD